MVQFLLVLLIFASPVIAQAQWFRPDTEVIFTHREVTGTVYNEWSSAIYCKGEVFGRTYYGGHLYAEMDALVYPGQWAYIYVYTDVADPFISAGGHIRCYLY